MKILKQTQGLGIELKWSLWFCFLLLNVSSSINIKQLCSMALSLCLIFYSFEISEMKPHLFSLTKDLLKFLLAQGLAFLEMVIQKIKARQNGHIFVREKKFVLWRSNRETRLRDVLINSEFMVHLVGAWFNVYTTCISHRRLNCIYLSFFLFIFLSQYLFKFFWV